MVFLLMKSSLKTVFGGKIFTSVHYVCEMQSQAEPGKKPKASISSIMPVFKPSLKLFLKKFKFASEWNSEIQIHHCWDMWN